MIQGIITVAISVLSATGILGIGTLRDRMLHCYNKYIEAGFAPIYAKENYENMYQQYHELGGNGVMTHLHEEFMALPTEKGETV